MLMKQHKGKFLQQLNYNHEEEEEKSDYWGGGSQQKYLCFTVINENKSNYATVNVVITQPAGSICILLLFLKLRGPATGEGVGILCS